jgi:beta-N-acetylhexosaminidase
MPAARPGAGLRLAVAAIKGMQENGMLATVKHFPGSDTQTDSHISCPLFP